MRSLGAALKGSSCVRALLAAIATACLGAIAPASALAVPVLLASANQETCATEGGVGVACWGNGYGSTPVKVSGLQAQRIVSLAVGPQGACAVQNGNVLCWTESESRPTASPVSGITGARSVAMSMNEELTCVLLIGGTIRCWGNNNYGQLGDGTTTDRTASAPATVQGIDDAIAVDVGTQHTCAIRGSGSVWCWGLNNLKQLGHAQSDSGAHPSPEEVGVSTQRISNAKRLSAGLQSSCAIRTTGTVSCWGYNNGKGQLGGPLTPGTSIVDVSGTNNATNVAAGLAFHCVTMPGDTEKATGVAHCWGNNTEGQLGDGTTTNHYLPQPVTGITTASAITAGFGHACAAQDGGVWCWGRNAFGQLGDGTKAQHNAPVKVLDSDSWDDDTDPPFSSLVGSSLNYCRVSGQAAVRCWGSLVAASGDWMEGNGLPGPLMGGLSTAEITDIDVGSNQGCVVQGQGINCWTSAPQLFAPFGGALWAARVIGLTEVKSVRVAPAHNACALRRTGTIWCWGLNTAGQLGIGTFNNSESPIAVRDRDNAPVTDARAIAVDGARTCAIRSGGTVWCWGTAWDSSAASDREPWPVKMPSIRDAVAISISSDTGCAIDSFRDVWCWGRNTDGRLGTATGSSPGRVTGLPAIQKIAVGGAFVCATIDAPTDNVWCWGSDVYGQTAGNGAAVTAPHPVFHLPGKATNIAAGTTTACAQQSSSDIFCWGTNAGASLGTGSPDEALTTRVPTAVDFSGHVSSDVFAELGRDQDPLSEVTTGGTLSCNIRVGYAATPLFGSKDESLCGLYVATEDGLYTGPNTQNDSSGIRQWAYLSRIETELDDGSGRKVVVKAHNPYLEVNATVETTHVYSTRTTDSTVTLTSTKAAERKVWVYQAATCGEDMPRTSISSPDLGAASHFVSCGNVDATTSVTLSAPGTPTVQPFVTTANALPGILVRHSQPSDSVQPTSAPTLALSWERTLPAAAERESRSFQFKIEVDADASRVDGSIDTIGPYSNIETTKDLRCGRKRSGPAPVILDVNSCGTWIAFGDRLYGPSNANLTAPWQRPGAIGWTPVSQAELGTGSSNDPYKIITRVRGGRDLLVTQIDSYVNGADRTTTEIRVKNVGTSDERRAAIFSAGDCQQADEFSGGPSSVGYGWRSERDLTSNAIGCASAPFRGTYTSMNPNPSGNARKVVLPDDLHTDSDIPYQSYVANTPTVVASQIHALDTPSTTDGFFDPDCLCADRADNAMGLSFYEWELFNGIESAFTYVLTQGRTSVEDTGTYRESWNMLAIGAPTAWHRDKVSGKGQIVAVIDTGVNSGDPWIKDLFKESCFSGYLPRKAPYLVQPTCASQWRLNVPGPTDTNPRSPRYTLPERPPSDESFPQPTTRPTPVDDDGPGVRPIGLDSVTFARDAQAGSFTDPGSAYPYGVSCDRLGFTLFQIPIGLSSCQQHRNHWAFYQGTRIAAIAAGMRPGRTVAPDAKIMAANISGRRQSYPQYVAGTYAGNAQTATMDWEDEYPIAEPQKMHQGLSWVISRVRRGYRVAAVNLMLPGSLDRNDRTGWGRHCSGHHAAVESDITWLLKRGIPVVVPAGSNGLKSKLPWPACLDGVISVGAVGSDRSPTSSSNTSPELTVLAPGREVEVPSMRGSNTWGIDPEFLELHYDNVPTAGTHIAAAHVTGAIALYKQKWPKASLYAITNALKKSGVPVNDRAGRSKPFLRVDRMLKIDGRG